MRIALCYPVEPRHIAAIAAAAPGAEIIDAGQQGIAELLPSVDIYCGHAKVPAPWEETVAAGRLKWVQSSAAGTDHCLTPEVIDSPILVSSASGVLAEQILDQTMALLLAARRQLPRFFAAQQRREFVRQPTGDLAGTSVGIVGLGGNGRRIAEALAAFRCRVLATDWFPQDKPAGVEWLGGAHQLDQMLPRVESLVLACPLNEGTKGLIDRRRLALLPAGAVLVNVARGPIVVEADLISALRAGRLGGAAIDVAAVEPPPADSPLWEAPNLVITPHVGGQRATRIDDMTALFCENLRRFSTGRRLINLCDKRLGFPRPSDCLWRHGYPG